MKTQTSNIDLQRRKEFCRVHGHIFTSWLPRYRQVQHKRCTYCGARKEENKESSK